MMSYASLAGWLATGLFTLAGCGAAPHRVRPDTTAAAPTPGPMLLPVLAPSSPPASVRATLVPLPVDSGPAFRRLLRDLGPDRLTLILKLNRVDLAHVRAGDSLLAPTDTTLGELDLAPFPTRLSSFDSVPKFLVVSQRIQAFAGYEFGHLVYWGPTSTGKRSTPTPNGLFHTNWKAKETRSTDNNEWLLKWYFNIENQRGVSFHQYELPGQPASHACIRLLAEDAEWVYRWADQWTVTADGNRVTVNGTPVLVFGDYAFGRPGPWRRVAADSTAPRISEAELSEALARFRDSIH